ncbi:MAG TPA: sulfite exporter TauE/SafE family protein [Candidatus Micrarchaeia archaeon]|nr:sulfite exporter TauE/SafE family protein [Candidatus Micrarchaeia archaeon]
MTLAAALLLVGTGLVAGAANAVVGSGSLATFPALLAVGLSPVVANATNTVGLVLGSVSGVVGYRRELRGQQDRIRRLALPAVAGGAAGAVLLLVLPGAVFRVVVPVLIALAVVLVLLQPRLARRAHRRPPPARPPGGRAGGRLLRAGVLGTAVYGGYFGAAQGVLLLAILQMTVDDTMQRLNGLKNVIAGLVNVAAAAIFIVAARVQWEPAAVLAGSTAVGAQLGAVVGRRLRPGALRAVIVVAGLAAMARLLL